MKVITRGVIDWATLEVEETECFEYFGPVALCGTLAFAAGGGLAGLGSGFNEVGKEAMKDIHDDALTRLTKWYADQRQQTGIQAQQAAQQAGFAEQEKMHGLEHGEAVAAAGAQRQFLIEQEQAREAAAQRRTEITAKSRTDVATIRAQQASQQASVKTNSSALFKKGETYNVPGGRDKYGNPLPGKKIPTYIGPGGMRLVQVPGTFDPNNPAATKYAPLGPNGEMPTIKALGRAPQVDIQDASDNPSHVQGFLSKYGFVTQDHVLNAVRPGQRPTGIPKGLPEGTTVSPAPGEVETDNAAEDARADAEDDAAASQQEADDNAPAREP